MANIPPFFDLSGKHILVAGVTAGGALARGLAVPLADAGANVSLTTLRRERAEEVLANSILNECWALGRKGAAKTVDLTSPSAVEAAVGELEREIGPIDVLVNAAHSANIKPVLECTLADWERELARNATATFVAAHAVGQRMVGRGKGRVINVLSILADRGMPNAAIFGASQGAILGFTKSLGVEWGRQGVNVIGLGLGFYEGIPGPQGDEEVVPQMRRYIPLARLGTPADLGATIVYLASTEARFIDSEIVVVDGAIQTHA